MKASEITRGGVYIARVSGQVVPVRVEAIREATIAGWDYKDRLQTVYDVTNLTTGRKTTFRSAQRFWRAAGPTETNR